MRLLGELEGEMPSQWERFKQSNIAKIVIGYSLVVWVLIQLIEAVLPTFETPLWVAQTLTFLLILGFPIALLVGWAYEKLPARSADADGVESVPQPAHSTPKKNIGLSWNRVMCRNWALWLLHDALHF